MGKIIKLSETINEKTNDANLNDAQIIKLSSRVSASNMTDLGYLISIPLVNVLSLSEKRENIKEVTEKYIETYYPIIGTHKYSSSSKWNGLPFQFARNSVHLLKCVFSSIYRAQQISLMEKDYRFPTSFIELLNQEKYFQKISPLIYPQEIEPLKEKYKYIIIDTIQKSYEAVMNSKKIKIKR